MLLLLLSTGVAGPIPTLDAVSTGNTNGAQLTISHTVGVHTNRLLVVSISVQDSDHTHLPVASVTYNGVALTRADYKDSLADVRSEQWYLVAPDQGIYNLIIQTSGIAFIGAVASSFYNVNQTVQPHTNGENSGNGVQCDVNITPLVNNTLIVDALSSESARVSLDSAQTSLGVSQGTVTQNISASYKVIQPAQSTNMISNIRPDMAWAYCAVAYNPTVSIVSYPTVDTDTVMDIGIFDAQFNGEITSDGGSDVFERGFEYNTVEYPGLTISEVGIFGSGTYSLNPIDLNPDSIYYVRAYAKNALGTSYGPWRSFVTRPATYRILINGLDRTTDVINQSPSIEDIINDQNNTCSFRLIDNTGQGMPSNDQEVQFILDDGTILFGGKILSCKIGSVKATGKVEAQIKCVDYVRDLDRNLVHRTYEDMTDGDIIREIVAQYCIGAGITTNHVVDGVTIDQISFNYIQPSQAFRKLSDITGKNWYIDYEKDIHYFPMTTNAAPFNIDASNNQYMDLSISKDASQIKNRVYVRGGTKLSDTTEYIEVGDGQKRKFVLPDRPHNVTVSVDTGAGYVTKTVGIKNIDTSGFDWYLNFQEKYLEQDSAGTVLSSTHKLKVSYKYDIPILIAQENSASIAEHGQHEFAIFDKAITTTDAARERALAELTDYANNIIEGSFKTFTTGFKSGQYIHIYSIDHGVDADYIIQKVIARSMGAGTFVYDVYIASSKTMGIIRFLIELLEANKNLIELDDNEVIDELLSVTDSLLSDSLLDSLTIDSAGPYATWSVSTEISPTTRARWDLFQWG